MKECSHAGTYGNPAAVIVFARAPEKGKVKTRLARDLDEKQVLALYEKFVAHSVSTALSTGLTTVVSCHPGEKKDLLKNLLGDRPVYIPQTGEDLGERMTHAFETVFRTGVEKAVIIGSDIPDIRPPHLSRAFSLLHDHPVVIGPSFDGGYWLIGFRKETFDRFVFHNIPWGTKAVLGETVCRCKKKHLRFAFLEKLRDIDTSADLEKIAFRLSS